MRDSTFRRYSCYDDLLLFHGELDLDIAFAIIIFIQLTSIGSTSIQFFTKEECGPFSCFRTVAEIEEERVALNTPASAPHRPAPPKQPSEASAPAQTPAAAATNSPMAPPIQNP